MTRRPGTKRLLLLREGQLLVVRGSHAQGLTVRGRVMKSSMAQLVAFQLPNRYFDIRLTHITGPMKGIHMQFHTALARKAKIQNTCLCNAYSYPHRKGKGACNAGS